MPCDVADFEAVRRAADAALKVFGKIDILVNNAATHASNRLSR
jgi:NAD(P)-dependent dehydrogenase (short-subunit alcohol dehydrogenase family)